MNVLKMTDLDLAGKRVLLREDLNVPIKDGKVASDARLVAALPAIRHALMAGAAVILLSHLGRPTEGEYSEENSLAPVAARLSELLGMEVPLCKEYLDGVAVESGRAVLCENVRFNKGEKKNDPALSKRYAALCDVFVMDAFATAHRAEASTAGVTEFAKAACAGPLLAAELDALGKAFAHPEHPLVGIIGGSKVSTKLTILKHLAPLVDTLIVGGGIANTFLLAQGHHIGTSLAEPALVGECKEVMKIMKEKGGHLPLPVDVVVAHHIGYDAGFRICDLDDIEADEMILDIGPKTSKMLAEYLKDAKTIIWNGPVGVFEMDNFKEGTRDLAEKVAEATANGAFTIVGGGDTIAAAKAFKVADKVSYISTGGGAFLEFLEGKTLPAIAALQERTK